MDYPYLDTVIYDNFYEMLKGRYETSSDNVAVRFMSGSKITDITYRTLTGHVASLYSWFRGKNFSGKHIAVISENRYEYIIIYLASVLDNVIIPLDRELDSGTLVKCLDDFDADLVFCTDKTADKIHDSSVTAVNIDSELSSVLEKNTSVTEFFENAADTDKDRFAVLASTSGTDGNIKGVMLSQYNVIVNVRGTLENNILENPTLAFLPMNHTYGFNPCMLATLYNGTTLCLCTQLKYLMRDIKTFDPFFFGAVPMVIEGMYDGIMREIKRRGKEKTFERMVAVSQFFLKFKIDLRHIFFGNFINKRLRLVVNGGAALNSDLVEKFGKLGISILNGYGLTECSPTIAVSRTGNNVTGSAGTIMKNIDVKIADDGEILVKGPNVMLGYYKNEEATAACMHDGYFATGDIGYTEGRVIFVTGRKKNLIITENGKNIPPEFLEAKLAKLPYVTESLVIQSRSGKTAVLKALIVLKDNEDGSTLAEDIRRINAELPDYMHIDEHEIMKSKFEKNSSKKIRRNLYV